MLLCCVMHLCWSLMVYCITQGPVVLAAIMAAGASRRSATVEPACCVAGLWRDSTACATPHTPRRSWAGCAGPHHPRAAPLCDDGQGDCVSCVCVWELAVELFILYAWVNVGKVQVDTDESFFKLVCVEALAYFWIYFVPSINHMCLNDNNNNYSYYITCVLLTCT